MFQKVLWLSVSGACGTVSRFVVCELAANAKTAHFPLGTFTVNIIGSFLFGLIYVLAQRRMSMNQEMRIVLLTGFMGAFTIFSAFAIDTAQLLKSSEYAMAFGNMFGQTALGVGALAAGVILGGML